MMTGYAPAYQLKAYVQNRVDRKLRGFKKMVHFPLSKGMMIVGGNGMPHGKVHAAIYFPDDNLMVGEMDGPFEPTDDSTAEFLLLHGWEEFNP